MGEIDRIRPINRTGLPLRPMERIDPDRERKKQPHEEREDTLELHQEQIPVQIELAPEPEADGAHLDLSA